MKKIVIILGFLIIFAAVIGFFFINKSSDVVTSKEADTVTKWELKPSLKYDVICFLNTLVGDEDYLQFYQEDYDKFSPEFTSEVTYALQVLKEQKQIHGIILGAWLSNLYSVTDDVTLEDMIETLDNDSEIWDKYKYTEEERLGFETYGKKNLKIIFSFLKENDFEGYWKENILQRVNKKIDEITELGFSNFDIIPEVEKYTGFKLGSDKITVYLLYFAQPHGIRVQGTNFITDISYPFDTVVGNAIHEMLHPPFQKDDIEFKNARDKLKDDELIQAKMASQNSSYGYSTFESFFEENCVDALEVLIREKFNILDGSAQSYFRNHDGGVDALGVAIYSLIKEDDYRTKGESFQEFFIRMVKTGKLAPGKVKELYDSFYADK